MPVPRGRVAGTPDEAQEAAGILGGAVAVKAQAPAGGRGKAGGVLLVRSPEEAKRAARQILGLTISGHPIREVLVEAAVPTVKEAYLSVVLDRGSRKHLIMASSHGGMDIEARAADSSRALTRAYVDPLLGLQDFQVRKMVRGLEMEPGPAGQAAQILKKLYRLYVEADSTLVEVNPLAVTPSGEVIALDAKVILDDSALFRHPDLCRLIPAPGQDSPEGAAARKGLPAFVRLEGNIGVIGNGAGLVMSTLDLIDQAGGRAANFLDVGGGAGRAALSDALSMLLSDARVKAVMVNIFGGITRGEQVAAGLVDALGQTQVKVPIVVRLAGNGADAGRRILYRAGHPKVVLAGTMLEAAQRAVEATS